MSTQPRYADTRTTSEETGPSMTTRDEPRDAPLMFSTTNRVEIQGHFDAESDDRPF